MTRAWIGSFVGSPDASTLDALVDRSHPRKRAAADWACDNLDDSADLRTVWKRCGAAGLFALLVPESLGGAERTASESLLSFEGLAYGCSDLGLVFAVVIAGVRVRLMFHGRCDARTA